MNAIVCAGLFCGFATSAACAQPVPYDFSQVTELAQGAITGQYTETPVPGFELLLMKDGQIVYDTSFGLWFNGRVANADSATKTLSGALIMSLTESSVIPFSLDSRLSDFYPQFSGEKQSITIRQCFCHTAGFGESRAVGDPSLSLQGTAIEIATEPLAFPPGTVFSYGGTSMQCAGAAGELAGGQAWDTLFAQRIATPLGMIHTQYVLTTPSNPRIAGGCESTAAEFARFMEMLRANGRFQGQQLLSPESVHAIFTRQTPVGIPINNSPLDGSADYGVGVWLDQRDAQGNLIGAIAAGARGFSCWIDFDDGMVGAFATDLTHGQNVRPVIDMIRDAAQAAVRLVDCPADINADGNVDQGDIDYLVGVIAGGPNPASADPDINHDGNIDQGDIDALVGLVAGGPCP